MDNPKPSSGIEKAGASAARLPEPLAASECGLQGHASTGPDEHRTGDWRDPEIFGRLDAAISQDRKVQRARKRGSRAPASARRPRRKMADLEKDLDSFAAHIRRKYPMLMRKRALTTKKPKTRYVVTPDPIQNLMVNTLPKRTVDRIIAGRLGLLQKQ